MKAVHNVLPGYIKLCYVYVKFKRANQVAYLQKLANQSVLNSALVIKMVNNYFSGSKGGCRRKQEKLWSFEKARKILIEKIGERQWKIDFH